MYAWIWNHLPGSGPLRALVALSLILALVAVLFLWVFPWLEPHLPFTEVTVETAMDSTTFPQMGTE